LKNENLREEVMRLTEIILELYRYLVKFFSNPEKVTLFQILFRMEKHPWLGRHGANIITTSRVVIILLLFNNFWLLDPTAKTYYSSMFLVAYCWVTDWLDGVFSRVNNARSQFGALYDRATDKLLDLVMFKLVAVFSPLLAWLIIGSEIILSVLGFIELRCKIDASSGMWGRFKFGFRCLAYLIFLSILSSQEGIIAHPYAGFTAMVAVYISLALGLASILFIHGSKIYQCLTRKSA
jgi:phosphatidylglycerophosphate synthase